METEIVKKEQHKFYCEKCDYKCSAAYHYKQHEMTWKHQKSLFGNKLETLETKPKLMCDCGKLYKNRDGLWKHKKKCMKQEYQEKEDKNANANGDKEDNTTLTNLVLEMVKQNQELTKQIVELSKNTNVTNNNNNCITNNTNNTKTTNKFNLNFFLNEKCKDAINIMDFVNSLQLQLKDLEQTGKLGFVEGISKIFVNGLKELDVYKRPIHCSDMKREVLYVKDEDKWEKENMEKEKITKAIQKVVHKNIQQIPDWVKQNPNCKDSDSKKNDQYLHLLINSMSGSDKEEVESNMNKIIHNISKEVVIDK
jgi:hypothetical protein